MIAPLCALCSMKWLQAVASEPLWPMPSSTANATIGTSASRLARRASFRLNEASPTGSCTECVRKCAPLFPLSAIGNAFTPKLSSARSNANSRPKHRAVLSPRNANKLSCSVWPTTFTNSGHSIFHLRPASKLFNSASDYLGSKWGVYLRAPDLYFELMERFGGAFVPLGEIAEVRYGFKSGC